MRFKSIVADNVAGSIGNITGQNTLGGKVLKQKRPPTNPNTTQQQRVRLSAKSAAQSWQIMTPEIRKGWDRYGATCHKTNTTGATVTLSGYNAFCRIYIVWLAAGISVLPLLLFAPKGNGFLAEADISLNINTRREMILTNNGSEVAKFIGYMGDVTRATTNLYKGSFRYRIQGQIQPRESTNLRMPAQQGRNWFRIQTYSDDYRMGVGRIIFIDDR